MPARRIAISRVEKPTFFADTSGSQLLEFAVALPLLVVFVVGIFDFGGAFDLKQKLSNIAREGARFASSLPTNDLDAIGTPPSVTAIRDLVVAHLQTARLNDCGLAGQAGVERAGHNLDLHRGGGRLRCAPGAHDRTRLFLPDGRRRQHF